MNLAEAGNKADMVALLKAEANLDSPTLTTIRSFYGRKNAIIATAIDCRLSSGTIVTYIDPSELWEPTTLIRKTVLTPEQWQYLQVSCSDRSSKPL
jgi:hypothetical protein